MLQLVGDAPDAANAGAQAILKLETSLATASLSMEVLRNPYASYHKMAVSDLAEIHGGPATGRRTSRAPARRRSIR